MFLARNSQPGKSTTIQHNKWHVLNITYLLNGIKYCTRRQQAIWQYHGTACGWQKWPTWLRQTRPNHNTLIIEMPIASVAKIKHLLSNKPNIKQSNKCLCNLTYQFTSYQSDDSNMTRPPTCTCALSQIITTQIWWIMYVLVLAARLLRNHKNLYLS